MSTEVEKKRGRPKKVITEPVDANVPESAKKTATRSKSTKAAAKTAKTTSASKASLSTEAKPAATRKMAPKAPLPSLPSTKAEDPKTEVKPSTKTPPKVTPETSKILNELRQQTAKTAPGNSSSPSKQPVTHTSPPPQSKNPVASFLPKPNPPMPKIPIAALNKQIVSDIATRAGAKPNAGGPGAVLPKNYKSVANKITMVIVALPVALVTSWVLYERCESSIFLTLLHSSI
jgi:uncharacterized phage infection (PIP) family protein YhgE